MQLTQVAPFSCDVKDTFSAGGPAIPPPKGPARALSGEREETITMPRVSAFHRDREGEKYHDNSQCGPGSEIPVTDRKSGTGGKPHCDVCADLNAKGK